MRVTTMQRARPAAVASSQALRPVKLNPRTASTHITAISLADRAAAASPTKSG
jgi:hypothetical protein